MLRMNCLFIFYIITFITTAHANTLIITRGPICNAMGSYLCNAITTANPSYHSLSQIDVSNMVYYQVFNTLFPKEMAILANAIDQENISYAITKNHIYFKESTYEEQRQQARDIISSIQKTLNEPANEHIYNDIITIVSHLVMADLAYHTACNHNVIWESGTNINFENEVESIKNSFDTVIETLTYYPPTSMVQHWQEKNNSAIAQKRADKRRLLKQVLESFFNNFKPVTDENNNAIITLTKDEFDTIIEQSANYIQMIPQNELGENGAFTQTEFTLDELMSFKEARYTEYNFDVVDHVVLAPTLSYDILLSSKEDCLNFAQNIADEEL